MHLTGGKIGFRRGREVGERWRGELLVGSSCGLGVVSGRESSLLSHGRGKLWIC